jgi:hypothetical protein
MNLSNEDLTNKFAEASHKGLLSTESFKLEQEILSCLASGEKAIQAMEWLEKMMTPDNDYCEIYLAGLRNFIDGKATSFQVESQPEKFKTASGKTLIEAIENAKKETEK